MKLEYVLIFTKDGVPIHSSCYGTFCANMSYDKTLLAGFISALSSMPSAVGHQDTIQNVEMGYTKMMFRHTHPSEYIICIGIIKSETDNKDEKMKVNQLFNGLEEIVEHKFKEQSWIMVSNEISHRLEEEIIHNVVEPTLQYFEDNDVCDHNGCPFDQISDHDHPAIPESFDGSFADRVSLIYENNVVPFVKRILAPIYIPLYRYFDKRRTDIRRESLEMTSQH